MLKRLLLAAAFALLPFVSWAQSTQQSGLVTPNHAACWVTNGVIGDCGPATNGLPTTFGITANNPCSFGINSTPISGAFEQLCFGAVSNGNAVISYQNFGGATAKGLSIVVNGNTLSFPATPGGTLLPTVLVPFTIGDSACFSDSLGTLKDCGAIPGTGTVTSVAAGTGLKATPSPIVSSGTIAVDPTQLSAEIDTAFGSTAGSLLQRGVSAWAIATPASVGASKVLLPNGCATASNSTNLFFTGLASAGFSFALYEIEIMGAQPITNGAFLQMQISENNGSTYKNSGYQWAQQLVFTNATATPAGSASATAIQISGGQANNDIENVTLRLDDPLNLIAGNGHYVHYFGMGVSSSNILYQSNGMGAYVSDTNVINAFQFSYSTGNISKGTICVYGIRTS